MGSVKITGSGKLPCVSGGTHSFLHDKLSSSEKSKLSSSEKSIFWGLRPNFFRHKKLWPSENQNFDFLTVFWKFLTFLENYPPKFEFFGSIKIIGCASLFLLLKRWFSSFCSTKSYDSRKYHFFLFVDRFWAFLDKYLAKSDIIGLSDPTGCWKLTPIICYG